MRFASLLAATALLVASGAQAQDSAPKATKPRPSAAKSTMPLVDGVVRQIEPSSGLVVLEHGDLPNLAMGPMTMGFDVADKKMLEGLKVGQKVKFQAEMIGGNATVTVLRRVR
jgi:Cu(I)/Ag(I) efflux system membrane protein CusA/SilA